MTCLRELYHVLLNFQPLGFPIGQNQKVQRQNRIVSRMARPNRDLRKRQYRCSL